MADPRSPDYKCSSAPLLPATLEQGSGNIESKTVHITTNSAAPSLTEKPRELPAQQAGWTSPYLEKTTLLSFAIAFLCLLVAAIALAIVDAKQDGIANAKSSEHYLWTYGPTAVLALVAALWNQVEYCTKDAMPWVLLQKGSTPASKTLLMDYITPSKSEALMASLRSSHWPVAIAITNSFLITLLTVASTGLLVLQSTRFVRHDCQLNVTDGFVTSFDPAAIGSASVLATMAIQNGTIPFPPGTSHNSAFQSLLAPEPLSGFADIEVEGITSSFHAGLDCEIATVTSGASDCSDWRCNGLKVTIGVTSPTCEVKAYDLMQGCGRQLDAISCDVNTVWGVACDSHTDDHDKNRLVFLVGQLKQNRGSASKNGTEVLEVVAGNTTTLVCKPQYNITDTNIRMDRNGNLKGNSGTPALTNHAQQFPAWDLVEGLRTAADAAGAITNASYHYSAVSSFSWYTIRALFINWVDLAHPSSNLRDPTVLQSRVNELFSMATAQMAKQSLMRASADATIGTCYGTEDRLRIRGLSLYLMGAVLILLVLSTSCLLYIAPRRYCSRDPSSIGGLALVLSKSPALLFRLSTLGSVNLKTVRRHLENVDAQTIFTQDRQNWQLAIELESSKDIEELDEASDNAESPGMTYWRPLSLRPVFKVLVIAALLALVIVLEVLLSVSQKQKGLADVDPQRYERFAWAYVPAIVMLTAQTLVGMIAFSSLMIFPYFRLRQRSSNTRSDILRNYVSETAIKCLWQSITAKHIVVVCMALTMLLTPLLTISVSGLYTAHETKIELPVTLSVRSQLNSSFLARDIPTVENPAVSASANNIGLLLTQNYTFPLWTYDELAFPEVFLEFPVAIRSKSSAPRGSNITVMLPGIRSDLNCSIASSVPTNFTDTIRGKVNITAFEAVGAYDESGGQLSWPSPGMHPFGFFQLCKIDGYLNLGNQYCGAFGTSEVNWNAFTCSSLINELDVEVTMDASTLVILGAEPIESTSRLFSNETLTSGSLGEFPSSMIPSLFGSSNFAGDIAGYYDPAFQAVVYGLGTRHDLDSFPMTTYLSNSGFVKITAQLQHVHRTVTAQSANLIRIPLNSTSRLAPPSTVNATLRTWNFYRLQQSAVSTRILDGLLVAIALCITLSFCLMDTRRVLPKNPASIAASASLIASNARMLQKDVLPEGAQWFSDAELKAKRVWDGEYFRLGWWDSSGPSEKSGQGKYFNLDSQRFR